MALLAECPKDASHKKFVTTAHVAEDWVVNEHGEFLENLGSTDCVAKPQIGNTWTCKVCGADAVVKDV